MNSNRNEVTRWPLTAHPVRAAFAAALVAAAGALVLPAAAAAYAPIGSLVKVDVYDRRDGTSLPVYYKDGQPYVVGVPGHEYALRIRNCTNARVLAVTSVDGVNVVTGDTASPSQSGYVIDAWGSVEIAGWRKSTERTAAFYFTDLGDSYAARTGRPGNVGVIGVAVFREKAPRVAQIAPLPYRERADASEPDAFAGRRTYNERAEAGAAKSAAPAYDAPASAESDGSLADSKRYLQAPAPAAAAPLGTGHGRSETSQVRMVAFERATSYASETVTIRYDRYDNLVAMGVIAAPRYAGRVPDPFPARFVPDPR